MAKVVTEKPRSGSSNSNRPTRFRLTKDDIPDHWLDREEGFTCDDGDHGPVRAKMSHYAYRRERKGGKEWEPKSFTDVLNPLMRYLRKQVGRPWNTVWSELSHTLDKRSLTGIHIFGHITSDVERDCWEGESGTVYSTGNWPVTGLYVHPRTGLLCYKMPRQYQHHIWGGAPEKPVDTVKVDDVTDYVRERGIWYRVHYGFVDRYVEPVFYRGYKKTTPPAMIRDGYWVKDRVLTGHKKQLGKKELAVAGLKNDPLWQPPKPVPATEPRIIRL